jgi:hypothetical protein
MRGEWQAEVSKLVTMSQEPKPERKVHTRYKKTLTERSSSGLKKVMWVLGHISYSLEI